eukprot:TRINITY_DN7201_c0_g1_i2.p1 TRINITY_DN7201_c0_g1~~TRINITY_DN7201_c0_g1_i2.p1  ORF type:complete len:392 (-),score=90.26 TRINITY_DN7201_c0_g1_i2:26-1201(-)
MGSIQSVFESDSTVVDLGKLVDFSDDSAIQTASRLLQRNGWVFVKLTPQFEALAQVASKPIAQYFTDNKLEDKTKHTEFIGGTTSLDGAVYGYNKQQGFKEGLRLLTGGRLNSLWIPQQIQTQVQQYVTSLDDTMLKILKVMSKLLFQRGESNLSSLPFLKGSPKSPSNFTKDNFAMLDIVYYQNHNPNSTSSISVAEHYDPGLLSLNVLSTQPGLQFKTSSGQWINVPEKVGVLWAGEFAAKVTNNTIKPGIHRVITPNPSDYPQLPPNHSFLPRLSIWVEICTEMQDFSVSIPVLKNVIADNENQNATFPTISLADFWDAPPTEPPMTSIPLLPGESLESALERASAKFGVPMTKSITYYCPICVQHVHNLLSHFNEEHKSTPVIKTDK